MLLIAWLSLLIWLVLLFGRGGFWRAQALERLSESTVHAVGQAEIARRDDRDERDPPRSF